MILVTDASSRIGSGVVRQLAATGHPTRAIVPSSSRASRFDSSIELAVGTLGDARTLPRALDGVHTVVLITNADPEMISTQEAVIVQSRMRGVQRIVKLSAAGVASHACCDSLRWHWHVEQLLLHCGIPSCSVRASRLMQSLESHTSLILSAGILAGCQGEGRVADVDVRDVSAVLATLAVRTGDRIVDESLADVTRISGDDDAMFEAFDLTGPAEVSRPELAGLLSTQMGRAVHYVDCAPSQLVQCAQAAGAPWWQAQDAVAFETFVRSGAFAYATTAVQQLLGRPARNLAAFVHEFAVSVRYANAPGLLDIGTPATMAS